MKRRYYHYPSNLDWWSRHQLYECNQKVKGGQFTVGQSFEALKKCWKGYKIALNQYDYDNMMKYAMRIQKLQSELEEPKCAFPNLGLDIF